MALVSSEFPLFLFVYKQVEECGVRGQLQVGRTASKRLVKNKWKNPD